MSISDHGFVGYTDLSRTFHINVEAEARELDRWLESPSRFGRPAMVEAFGRHGPGPYHVIVSEGWDRGGDYVFHAITYCGAPLTVKEFKHELSRLRRRETRLNAPFDKARELRDLAREKGISQFEAYEQLDDKSKRLMSRMDVEAARESRDAVANFLNGF